MDLATTPKMVVREVMSSPVISVEEGNTVVEVAKLMKEQKVGAIIIMTKEEQAVGIVTERDVVNRVVAENLDPNHTNVKSIMSSPLRTVDPETNIIDALSLMDQLNIRRLGVTYKGRLVGVLSDRNIIRMIPTYMELVKEHSRIEPETGFGPSVVGYCERCEVYSTNLRAVDGEFLCEDCRTEA